MTEEICRLCLEPVKVMCQKNTGFCSALCQETYEG